MASHTKLQLPSLHIEGFRGIDCLTIPRLGQVTLIAGKNSVGKTTLLEAVQVYAARGNISVLHDLLVHRREVINVIGEDGEEGREPNWAALFHGRDASSDDAHISIGSLETESQLTLETALVDPTSLTDRQSSFIDRLYPDALANEALRMLKRNFQGNERLIPVELRNDESEIVRVTGHYPRGSLPRLLRSGIPGEEPAPGIKCRVLGPGLLSTNEIGRFWDQVALTDAENEAVQVLRLIFGDEVDRVAVVGGESERVRYGRRVVVKLRSHDRPVPLKSLGDGAIRLFSAAIALANSRGGFLLIDEAENGIHHSVQRDYWRMVLHAADENNVQVIATTHSWDCIKGFAQAAIEEEAEGVAVRLERDEEGLRAVEYSEEALHIAAEQGIEVR